MLYLLEFGEGYTGRRQLKLYVNLNDLVSCFHCSVGQITLHKVNLLKFIS